MPWTPKQAMGKTKKANTPKQKKTWSKVANAVLKKSDDDAKAIKIANSVIKKEDMSKGYISGGSAKK